MRYILKHKLLSIGGDSMIKDEHGQDVYFVDGAAISLGRRLTIKDMKGEHLAVIQQQIIALTPTFEIEETHGVKAHLSMKLLSLIDHLKIDVSGGDDLEAHGDIFHHEYSIDRGGRTVAQISKAWIAITDSYGIEIDDQEDQVLLLSCAVVIDAILELREHAH
ncbi:MAG TPA: LURP-one-related family protein [Anaerolineaceae bacterium]